MGSDSVPSIGIPQKYQIWGDGSAAPPSPPAPPTPVPRQGKGRWKWSNINFKGQAQLCSPMRNQTARIPGWIPTWCKAWQGQILAFPPQHAIAKASLEPPPLRLHACTRSCDRQGCGWVVSPSPVPPGGVFPCSGLSLRHRPWIRSGVGGRAGGQAPVAHVCLGSHATKGCWE